MTTSLHVFSFFFFQAEDGIRDDLVTGVQTCALPISPVPSANCPRISDCANCAWIRYELLTPAVLNESRGGSLMSPRSGVYSPRASIVLMTMLARFARSISDDDSSVSIDVITKPGDTNTITR